MENYHSTRIFIYDFVVEITHVQLELELQINKRNFFFFFDNFFKIEEEYIHLFIFEE